MEKEIMKDETLPPGFRFHPTDEELITCYLINKISDANFTARAVTDVDLNKCEPWDLPGIVNITAEPAGLLSFPLFFSGFLVIMIL